MGTTKSKGLTDGITSEWTVIGKVKSGQEKALREYIKALITELTQGGYVTEGGVGGDRADFAIVGTVHDTRWTPLENGTRMMFASNFDGDWSQYIDDFFAAPLTQKVFDGVFSHCEGYPGASAPVSAKKEYFQAHTQEAAYYSRAYRGTVKEIWKALSLQKAFQEVLDHPDAAKALAHPALKPLLAHAAK